jgi:hypothetical protein
MLTTKSRRARRKRFAQGCAVRKYANGTVVDNGQLSEGKEMKVTLCGVGPLRVLSCCRNVIRKMKISDQALLKIGVYTTLALFAFQVGAQHDFAAGVV